MTKEEFVLQIPETIEHPQWGKCVLAIIEDTEGVKIVSYKDTKNENHFSTFSHTWLAVYYSLQIEFAKHGLILSVDKLFH